MPSWEVLEAAAASQMKALGVNLWPEVWHLEDAPCNPCSLKRTFGQPDSSIRVKLYRDHAGGDGFNHLVPDCIGVLRLSLCHPGT